MDRGGSPYNEIATNAAIMATGAEPGAERAWVLKINPEIAGKHMARFSHPDKPEDRVFALTRFAGNNGLGFSGEVDGQAVQVAITPGDCRDGASERDYDFTATVSVGRATLLGCAST